MTLGLRNAWRRRRRYASVMAALAAFGLAFIVVFGVLDRVVDNLGARARLYYGGDATLVTYRKTFGTPDNTARDPRVVQALLGGLPGGAVVGLRHVFRDEGTEFSAGGRTQAVRLLVGIDGRDEAPLTAAADFLQAPSSPDLAGSTWVPRSLAVKLGVAVGSEVTAVVSTYTGQRNTVRWRVSAILGDDAIFGKSVAYVDRRDLNRLTGKPDGWGTENPISTTAPNLLRTALARGLDLWGPFTDKKTFLTAFPRDDWSGSRSQIFLLSDHLREFDDALAALKTGLVAVAVLVLLTALLGLNTTLKFVLHGRTRELGTLRALGMTKARLAAILGTEVGAVVLAGTGVGIVAGWAILAGLSVWDLSGVALLGPLLNHGTLGFRWNPLAALAVLGSVAVGAALVLGPLLVRTSGAPPAQSLATGF